MSTTIARLDLTDPEVVKDAEAQLLKAEMGGGAAAFEAWARTWARPALEAVEELGLRADGADWEGYP